MTAQLMPVTLCRLMQPAAPTVAEVHAHEDQHPTETHSHASASLPAGDRNANGSTEPDCCDDPLNSCCIDGLRATLLVSRDGMGASGDYFTMESPASPVIVVPVVFFVRITPARFLGPPPYIPETTILQL